MTFGQFLSILRARKWAALLVFALGRVLLQWLQGLHGTHACHQLMIRKMLAMRHRRDHTTYLIQCLRAAQTTARPTRHVAATLFECDETFPRLRGGPVT